MVDRAGGWASRGLCVTEHRLKFCQQPPLEQIRTCQQCPVRSQCLEDALADERLSPYQPTEVRGGFTAGERQQMLKCERVAV